MFSYIYKTAKYATFQVFDCPEQELRAADSFLLEVLVDPVVKLRLDRGSEILVVFFVVAPFHCAGCVRFALRFIFHIFLSAGVATGFPHYPPFGGRSA